MIKEQISSSLIHPMKSLGKLPDDIPNPFERRQFAFQVLPKEKDPMSHAILHDLRHIANHIAESNQKISIFNISTNRQHRLKTMMNTLHKILCHLTDQGELLTPLGEFLSNKIQNYSNHHDDISIEEEITNLENRLHKDISNPDQNQRHLLIINRLKEKFYKKK